MKKSVKFSGGPDDDKIYITVILTPLKKERLEECLDLITSSLHLGDSFDDKDGRKKFEMEVSEGERIIKVDVRKDKIILGIRYETMGVWASQLEDVKRDFNYLIEQIETVIDALEEEAE